jgi:hypothetical protein
MVGSSASVPTLSLDEALDNTTSSLYAQPSARPSRDERRAAWDSTTINPGLGPLVEVAWRPLPSDREFETNRMPRPVPEEWEFEVQKLAMRLVSGPSLRPVTVFVRDMRPCDDRTRDQRTTPFNIQHAHVHVELSAPTQLLPFRRDTPYWPILSWSAGLSPPRKGCRSPAQGPAAAQQASFQLAQRRPAGDQPIHDPLTQRGVLRCQHDYQLARRRGRHEAKRMPSGREGRAYPQPWHAQHPRRRGHAGHGGSNPWRSLSRSLRDLDRCPGPPRNPRPRQLALPLQRHSHQVLPPLGEAPTPRHAIAGKCTRRRRWRRRRWGPDEPCACGDCGGTGAPKRAAQPSCSAATVAARLGALA